jgi:hypothetical protein
MLCRHEGERWLNFGRIYERRDRSPIRPHLSQLGTNVSESDFPVIKVDTKGMGEGMGKLADLAKSAGVLAFGPGHRVRMAKADAKALKIRAEAEIEVRDLHQRAIYRLTKEAEREQQNIEAIYQEAVNYLPPHVSEEPVSPEWVAKFNDRARFASEDEIRSIWAKILASEVGQPGSVSPRTIALMDSMTAGEARALQAVLAHAALTANRMDLVVVRAKQGTVDDQRRSLYGVSYTTFENLRAFGLIAAADDTSLHSERGQPMALQFGDRWLTLTHVGDGEAVLPVFLLTQPSREIAQALHVPSNQNFIDTLCEWAPTIGFSVSSPLPVNAE